MNNDSPKQMAARICDALGLDSERVRMVSVTLEANEWPLVIAEKFVFDPESRELETVLRRYRLKPDLEE